MIRKPVTLINRTETGQDALGNPVYEESPDSQFPARFTPWDAQDIALEGREVTVNQRKLLVRIPHREFPDCQVERMFLEKEGNIAFSIAPFQEELYDVTELESFPIKLLVHKDHPLSRRDSVTIQDLKGEKIYIENSEFKIYHLIYDRCVRAGFTPDIVFETSGFSLCHKLCAQNKGITVTVDFIFEDMKAKDTVMLPFSDGDYEWKVCMLTRRGEYVSRETELFQKHVMRWMEDISA